MQQLVEKLPVLTVDSASRLMEEVRLRDEWRQERCEQALRVIVLKARDVKLPFSMPSRFLCFGERRIEWHTIDVIVFKVLIYKNWIPLLPPLSFLFVRVRITHHVCDALSRR